jgi:hypothetical protein
MLLDKRVVKDERSRSAAIELHGPLPALDDEYRFVINDIGFPDLL